MKTLFTMLFFLIAHAASAQTPIIIGPNSTMTWDDLGTPVATASGLGVNVVVDAAAPKALTGIVCGPGPTAADATCSAPISQIPTGSHAITLINVSGALQLLPSTPFAYVTLLIPVPSNVRVK